MDECKCLNVSSYITFIDLLAYTQVWSPTQQVTYWDWTLSSAIYLLRFKRLKNFLGPEEDYWNFLYFSLLFFFHQLFLLSVPSHPFWPFLTRPFPLHLLSLLFYHHIFLFLYPIISSPQSDTNMLFPILFLPLFSLSSPSLSSSFFFLIFFLHFVFASDSLYLSTLTYFPALTSIKDVQFYFLWLNHKISPSSLIEPGPQT